MLGSFSGYDSTPVLKEALRNVVGLRPEPGEKRSYGQCADLIAQVLAAYGWPGDQAPDSDEYQAIEAFREKLGQIRSLDLVAGGTTLAGALSELQARLRLQPFQPETVSSPVEILGVVESAGLEFDALWFGNQVTGSWPPEPTINPFIPRGA